jgi:hypothetical protein
MKGNAFAQFVVARSTRGAHVFVGADTQRGEPADRRAVAGHQAPTGRQCPGTGDEINVVLSILVLQDEARNRGFVRELGKFAQEIVVDACKVSCRAFGG